MQHLLPETEQSSYSIIKISLSADMIQAWTFSSDVSEFDPQ